jgi:Golgi nucleoside diphosphatase
MYHRVETQPGLDTFVGQQSALRVSALQPLLDWAQAVVPPSAQATTPVFLLATGGVRRLHHHQQAQLMEDIRAVLSSSGFK